MPNCRFRRYGGRNAGQQACVWCGRIDNHYWGDRVCQVDQPMKDALCEYARANGRRWKSKLAAAWTAGEELGPDLRRVRNVLGPRGLARLSTSLVVEGSTDGLRN